MAKWWPNDSSFIFQPHFSTSLYLPLPFFAKGKTTKKLQDLEVSGHGCPSLNRVANVFVHQLFQLQSTFFLCQLTWQLSTCFSSHGFKECLRNKLRHRFEGSPFFFKHPRLPSLSPPCWLDVICKAFLLFRSGFCVTISRDRSFQMLILCLCLDVSSHTRFNTEH